MTKKKPDPENRPNVIDQVDRTHPSVVKQAEPTDFHLNIQGKGDSDPDADLVAAGKEPRDWRLVAVVPSNAPWVRFFFTRR